MVVDILGTGLTLSSYNWDRQSYKWGLSAYRGYYKKPCDLYFAMHEGQSIGADDEIGLMEWSGSKYFTSSGAYMIAYALYSGHKEINLYGFDMETTDEYRTERACIAYWIGFGSAIGATVKTANGLTEPAYKYGYDGNLILGAITDLTNRITEGDEKQQWIGAMYAYTKILENIRS